MTDEIKHKKFSFDRVLAVAGRVLKQFRRDHRTFAMMIFMPILFMAVFGIVLSGDIKNVPVTIEMNDVGILNNSYNYGQDIYDTLMEDDRVALSSGNYSDGINRVENGELVAAIQIAWNFTAELTTTRNSTITIYIDATKPQIKGTLYTAIAEAMQEVMGGMGIQFEETLAYDEKAEFSGFDVSIPAVMGYILTFLILLITVLTAIREDLGKTKLRLFTTPLTSIERILGYVLALTFFAMIETALVLGIAIYVFGTTILGSVLLLFSAGFLYGVAHILLGILLSNFAKNELQSVQMAVLVAIPSLALSGMMIPIDTFPPAVAAISAFIPMTYGIRAFEGIMLRGWGIDKLTFEFGLIGILTVAFFILALISSSDKSKD